MFRKYLQHTPLPKSKADELQAAAIDYLDSGKVKVEGIVNKTYKLEQWAECLEAMKNKTAIKAAIIFD